MKTGAAKSGRPARGAGRPARLVGVSGPGPLRIAARFTWLASRKKKALVPFWPIGFPTLDESARVCAALEAEGADILELGVPFTDSLADGPVVQKAYHRALENGFTVDRMFSWLGAVRSKSQLPIVLMCAFNVCHRMGLDTFAERASKAGVDALLCPDLPLEESTPLAAALAAAGMGLVTLVAPTTPPRRAQAIAGAATAFVYYISRKGVTGTGAGLPDDVVEAVARVKAVARVPVVVGFGISNPEQAAVVARACDGVVVGSALLSQVEAGSTSAAEAVGHFTRSLRAALD